MSLTRRGLLAAGLSLPFVARAHAARPPLRIGVTLHPYYSWVANIAGDAGQAVPLVPVGFNPHAYEPRAEDIRRIGALDAVVLNGIGHDDFAGRMIAASERPDVPVIEANRNVPLLPAVGAFARGLGDTIGGRVVNSHTFLSIAGAISQVQTIATDLGALHPDRAEAFAGNARAYNRRLRKLRADALAQVVAAPSPDFRVATIHGAYDYLLREFGLEVSAVVEPAHGIEPSPSQLARTIEKIRAMNVSVIFSESNFPSAYVETIQAETGVTMYPLSHIIHGDYTPEKFETEMGQNLATVTRAIREAGQA
ncbi:zinc transport system substrate-binding protein [Paracoccus aminovorans]|uniref:High-affinity zinc uptake system protein ZnuA n=1 Tax=Paracoccus aminovorans TaxID=34004 RepID=A0A1I2XSI0_9RHOB|nr:zinc ABC transporter substrate-binding protein [Paracoccus aminovorans]CQR87282.1 zinc transport system, periplasmic component/surface adhesin [Paracoccus aminovorans]SFH16057.1 zinc transport system substrate-binding protein [Paracoccus aminovorans]